MSRNVVISSGIMIVLIILISNRVLRIQEKFENSVDANIILEDRLDSLKTSIANMENQIDAVELENNKLVKSNKELVDINEKLTLETKKLKHMQSKTPTRSSRRVLESSEVPKTTSSIGNFQATAYCNCSICCGKWAGGKTASGTMPKQGRTIAVDKKLIPLGSKVLVNGKQYMAEDTGSAIKGKIIDVYFDSHQEALKFGRQKVDVKIIK